MEHNYKGVPHPEDKKNIDMVFSKAKEVVSLLKIPEGAYFQKDTPRPYKLIITLEGRKYNYIITNKKGFSQKKCPKELSLIKSKIFGLREW